MQKAIGFEKKFIVECVGIDFICTASESKMIWKGCRFQPEFLKEYGIDPQRVKGYRCDLVMNLDDDHMEIHEGDMVIFSHQFEVTLQPVDG